MKKLFFCLSLLLLVAAGARPVPSAEPADMGTMGQPQADAPHISLHSAEYMRGMGTMNDDMMAGIMDPDPDTAFVKGMIPHHKGAVAMARTELRYGKDPELRKLAEDIIAAQEKEIVFMERWLQTHGTPTSPSR